MYGKFVKLGSIYLDRFEFFLHLFVKITFVLILEICNCHTIEKCA